MMGKLHLDLMFQDCYILNDTPIKLCLIRSEDTFAIVSPMDNISFKVKPDSVQLAKDTLSVQAHEVMQKKIYIRVKF